MGSSSSTVIEPDDQREECREGSGDETTDRRKLGDGLKITEGDRSPATPRIPSDPPPGAGGEPKCHCPRAKPCPALPYIVTKKPRFANRLDIPRITEILLAALPQDPFYIYLWQLREDFPNDHRFYWEHRMYDDLFNPRYVFLVVELDSQRADKTCEWVKVRGSPIISFAIWDRKGNSEGALKWEEGRLKECHENRALSVVNNVCFRRDFPNPRRDAHPKRYAACTASLEQTDKDFSASLSPDRLQMELVCTYPCYQRRGAASQLVQWGLERAHEEKLKFASAAASICGERLYQKNGFGYLKGHKRRVIKVDDEDDETNYALMVWQNPKG
ncbi:MAG: hypothetical protein M1839_004592 [Geoglossum umbratile]|nr:MAG: hypothetical protein M1839_004592 [Geoglossum umbratile]